MYEAKRIPLVPCGLAAGDLYYKNLNFNIGLVLEISHLIFSTIGILLKNTF
jgi:hypothetical protein